MKIEIAESMVFSWLRKVKSCRVVQTNWKPAPDWPRLHDAELLRLMQASDAYFSEALQQISKDAESPASDADATAPIDPADTQTDESTSESRIFKKTANLDQLIAQTECDVLGLTIENGKFKAIAVEVAFHENGLNYSGGRMVTAKKIVSKFLRIIFALRAYLGVDEAELIFASPHVKNATLLQVNRMMDELNSFLASVQLTGFSVSVLFNGDFYSELMAPLMLSVKNYGAADGSELFTRALKLLALGSSLPAESASSSQAVARAESGGVVFSAPKSRKMAFKDWLLARGIKASTANSYVSGVNTSAAFAAEKLGWQHADFFAEPDSSLVLPQIHRLLALPSFREFSKLSNDSRKCGLERYAEFIQSSDAFPAEPDSQAVTPSPFAVESQNPANPEKIAAYVQSTVLPILQSRNWSEDEIKQLTDLEYCRRTFKLSSYPLLVADFSRFENKRFYKSPICITVSGQPASYYLCSQLVEKQRPSFELWVQKYQL